MNKNVRELHKKKVLIVDDEIELANIISEQLNHFGYEAIICTEPSKAKDFILEHKIDLVISDMQMPLMTGDLLYKSLKENFKEDTPPIIFMSGSAEFSKEDAKKLGAINLLKKPFSLKNLKKDLEEALAA